MEYSRALSGLGCNGVVLFCNDVRCAVIHHPLSSCHILCNTMSYNEAPFSLISSSCDILHTPHMTPSFQTKFIRIFSLQYFDHSSTFPHIHINTIACRRTKDNKKNKQKTFHSSVVHCRATIHPFSTATSPHHHTLHLIAAFSVPFDMLSTVFIRVIA